MAKKKTTSKGKSKSNKGTQKLKAIVARAHEIREASPRKKWTACISQAAKELR